MVAVSAEILAYGIKESFPLNKLPMSDGSPAKSKGKEFDWGPTVNPFEKTSDYASAKWAADQISTRDFDGKTAEEMKAEGK